MNPTMRQQRLELGAGQPAQWTLDGLALCWPIPEYPRHHGLVRHQPYRCPSTLDLFTGQPDPPQRAPPSLSAARPEHIPPKD